MGASYLTLTYAGVETSISTMGFTDPLQRINSQGKSTFTMRIPGAASLLSAPPIPYGGAVKITKYPLGVAANKFIIFQGKQITNKLLATREPAGTLTFADAWHDLEMLVFQQQANFREPNGTVLYAQPTSRLNLFQPYYSANTLAPLSFAISVGGTGYQLGDILTASGGMGVAVSIMVTSVGAGGTVTGAAVFGTGAYTTPPTNPISFTGGHGSGCALNASGSWQEPIMSAGQQVQEILNWAITCGVAIQIGTINLPWLLPIYPAKGITCDEAIQLCMKPSPDAVCWLDHTTTPPTFSVVQRPSLTPSSLPYADGQTHSSSDITARYDLQPAEVVFQYHKVFNVNGAPQNQYYQDAYPPTATGKVIGDHIIPIELGSGKMSVQTARISAQLFDPTDQVADVLGKYWWYYKKPELQGYFGVTLVNGTATVTQDTTGYSATIINGVVTADPNGILTAYPNELVGNDPPLASGFSVIEVTVKGSFTYIENDPLGRNVNKTNSNGHQFSTRVKLTNAPIGTGDMTWTNVEDYGEYPIIGLAQSIWTTLNVLAFEGTHRIVEKNATGQPDPGAVVGHLMGPQYALNLTGGQAAWSSMNATIQQVEIDHMRGITDITFGPPKHLAPATLAEMLQFYRYRWTMLNAGMRQTGELL